ncbi:MAG TPA: TonB family protein [Thermoanaerobaculia bacterium]|nr:TonB family protein [Thermoanaerobaculia bacterium]
MSLAVDRILERRARRESRRPEAVSLAAAAALHGIALALVLVLPRLNPPPPPPSFVPVQIIPAQALGVRHPAPRPKTEKPAPPKPEPAAEEPEPPAPEPPKPKPKPEPERPAPKPVKEEAPTLPEKPDKKKPEKPKPEKPRPASTATGNNPAGTAQQGDANGEAGRRGAPTGNPLGTTAFGSQIAGLDNPDFKFGYYIDQLLSAIDSKWVRPPLGNDVKAVISFRIQRDGSLTDLQVAQSSGYNSFDLAALRAVQNASPFAPLPRAYRNDSLGVTLIVR